MNSEVRRAMLRGAWLTAMILLGGLVASIGLGNVIFHLLPGSNVMAPRPLHAIIGAIPTTAALVGVAAAWGIRMGTLAQAPDRRRLAIAGVLGVVPVTVVLVFALLGLEKLAVDRFGARLPIHRVYTILFVPTASLIAGVACWVLARGLRDRELARSLPWRAGLAAGVAFLAVNLAMEAAGWVVGAPGASERATMVVVTCVGALAAALAGGAMAGHALATRPANLGGV
jgi:hypothetical protein